MVKQNNQQALAQLKKDVWRKPLVFIGSGFGLGVLPITPGTFASLGGLIIYFFIMHWSWWAYLAVFVLVTVIAVWLSDHISKQYQLHDPTVICLDEFSGILITLFLVPITWFYIILGFALFRLFDIWKPWLVGMIDRNMDSGFGMILDDVVAGIFAWIILQAIHLIQIYYMH